MMSGILLLDHGGLCGPQSHFKEGNGSCLNSRRKHTQPRSLGMKAVENFEQGFVLSIIKMLFSHFPFYFQLMSQLSKLRAKNVFFL